MSTVRLDERFLADHASYVADDIEERGFRMPVRGGWCFAIQYRSPQPKDLGFVISHSYGREIISLRRLERAVARTLAGQGHPVISFNRRGYGDSSGSAAEATLERDLEDTRTAAEHLATELGTTRLGLVGTRLGSLISGLIAREGGVDRLLFVNPALHGERYFRQFVKDKLLVQLTLPTSEGSERASVDDSFEDLRRDGMVDLIGVPLYRHLYESLSGVDLVADVGNFDGDALVVLATKRSTPPRDVEAFGERVRSSGGSCRIELVAEPPGAKLGHLPFIATTNPLIRQDLQRPILTDIASLVTEWVRP